MAENTGEKWDEWIAGLRQGDDAVCMEFWSQFGPALEGMARKQLSDRLQRRVGADDIVQSACRTFFRRMSAGQFELEDSDALWRLMCALTLTKARRAARDQSRLKRGMQNEVYIDAARSQDGDSAKHDLPDQATSNPVSAALFADELNHLLEKLSPQECQVLEMKLANHTVEEIAAQLQCSERTVRRVSSQIRERWTELFDATES